MKYVCIEIQKYQDGQVANLVSVHDDYNSAMSKYHLILSAAAISVLPSHAACVFDEQGSLVANGGYRHEAVE